jgi:hypothetical protein
MKLMMCMCKQVQVSKFGYESPSIGISSTINVILITKDTSIKMYLVISLSVLDCFG